MDTVAVVHFGGAILWQQSSTRGSTRTALINHLIQNVLLEDRAGSREFVIDNYKLRWTLHNSSKFMVVAICPKFVVWRYIDSFLKEITSLFSEKYDKQIACGNVFDEKVFDFDADYAALLSKLETSEHGASTTHDPVFVTDSDADDAELQDRGSNEASPVSRGRAHEDESRGGHADDRSCATRAAGACPGECGADKDATSGRAKSVSARADDAPARGAAYASSRGSIEDKDGDEDKRVESAGHTKPARRVAVLRGKGGKVIHIGSPSSTNISGNNSNSTNNADNTKKKKKKPVKLPTVSDKPGSDVTAVRAMTEAELQAQTEMQKATYIKRLPNGAVAPLCAQQWDEGDAGSSRGGLSQWLRGYLGQRAVDEADLRAMIPLLRDKLIAKNVAVEVTEHVCRSVETSLTGTRLGTFDSLHRRVQDAMVSALTRILQPTHEVNILRDVARAAAAGRPYSIVLCGVNGVGKSTSLAKVAYWLKQNGYSLLIAAGDTFRHGAVEQLEVHGRCLGVPVFQMGYGSDPSAVAAAALAQAARQRIDVVMIDTAGRMQDHESRMRALAKLIHDNTPDLVLFVGEALVGNNGVDQLRKFNRCLVEYAPMGSRRRGIDGIVLTKFDTIDDKVGAALSMVYELGQPIVFVGVGQTYQDLKVIDANVVVSALMK